MHLFGLWPLRSRPNPTQHNTSPPKGWIIRERIVQGPYRPREASSKNFCSGTQRSGTNAFSLTLVIVLEFYPTSHLRKMTIVLYNEGYLHFKQKVPRLTCPRRESNPYPVGGEYSRKEPLEYLVNNYSEHLLTCMSVRPRRILATISKKTARNY